MFQTPIELIDCQSLYNLLNEGVEFSRLTDPSYLYLLDCRPRFDYNESHIICAKRIKTDDTGKFVIPYESELECRNIIVVYDGNTTGLKDDGDAVQYAHMLVENGAKNTVRVLKGGYELFSRMYPFLRTQQVIYMPSELDLLKTYPSEIIPGLLYLGNSNHAKQAYIKKDLKLKAYLNCTVDDNFEFADKSATYFQIPIDDSPSASITEYATNAFNFIDSSVKDRKEACLVYSNYGISRSAVIVILYLVLSKRISVDEAFSLVSKCRKIQPQVEFLNQIKEIANSD